MEHWDYAHNLPYFMRAENRIKGPDDYHGTQGPLVLETGPCKNPLFAAFLRSAKAAGYPLTDDVNGFQQEGFGRFDRNIQRGRRLSAARAYLHPVLKERKNLDLVCRALTTRINFEGKKAVGVDFLKGGKKPKTVKAGEVICCGGAINSPQILQLSGIGNAVELEALDIPVVHHLPGVGENLQDHLEVYVQYACKKPVSMNPSLAHWKKPFIGYQWLFHRSGAASTNHFEAGGFIRSNDEVEYPNIQFHFLPLAIRYDGSQPSQTHGYQVHVGPMYSNSRGSIKLKSADPRQHPALRFNYLSTPEDRREWVEAIRHARRILNQPEFDEFNAGETSPGLQIQTDQDILDWVARDAETALHPSCTCKMGTDEMAVVDPATMAVHGVENLRVVDASVMPVVTNGNIYSPTMMIAEKACDMILGNTLEAPSQAPFYRHSQAS